jgi:hypothetical protein
VQTYDFTEYECGTCGERFEPGDRAIELWRGEVDGDGTWRGQDCEFHHSACVRVADDRPPVRRIYVTERTGTAHIVPRFGGPACGTVSPNEGDVEEVGRLTVPELMAEYDLCAGCLRGERG